MFLIHSPYPGTTKVDRGERALLCIAPALPVTSLAVSSGIEAIGILDRGTSP
jgi:hypothetical protein